MMSSSPLTWVVLGVCASFACMYLAHCLVEYHQRLVAVEERMAKLLTLSALSARSSVVEDQVMDVMDTRTSKRSPTAQEQVILFLPHAPSAAQAQPHQPPPARPPAAAPQAQARQRPVSASAILTTAPSTASAVVASGPTTTTPSAFSPLRPVASSSRQQSPLLSSPPPPPALATS